MNEKFLLKWQNGKQFALFIYIFNEQIYVKSIKYILNNNKNNVVHFYLFKFNFLKLKLNSILRSLRSF